MSIEPVGFLTIVIGILSLMLGYQATFITFVVATMFGSAAAVLIGSANIQPGHLLLGFVALITFQRPRQLNAAIDALKMPRPAFWMMCLVIYGVMTAILVPRLLAGATQIIPLGSSEYADTGGVVPLGPVSSNFTQSLYIVADLICFMITVAIASTDAGFMTVTQALIAYAGVNALMAILDVVTFSTGTQWLLEFIRNAQYTLHNEEEIIGLKRIVGSFPEASAFARSTLGALGFTGTLWLCGYRSALNGPLAIVSLALVILSTSSTGLAGTLPLLIILYATALARNGFDLNSRPYGSTALLCTPIAVAALACAVLLNETAFETVRNYLDLLIFSKSGSDSGIERSSWNSIALQNFLDTFGVGVGLGTARTSSLPFALLSNVGIVGLIFYLIFICTALFGRGYRSGTFPSDVRLAARNACLGLIIGDCLAAPSVEQGLLFSVLAGLASADPISNAHSLTAALTRPPREAV